MSEQEIRHPDGRIEHPAVRFERRDIHFGWVLALVVAACCVLVVHFAVTWKIFEWQKTRLAKENASPYSVLPSPVTIDELPPAPRLEQIDRLTLKEHADISKRLLLKEKDLHSFGPTTEKGFVHVPIEDAIKTIANELPVRTEEKSP